MPERRITERRRSGRRASPKEVRWNERNPDEQVGVVPFSVCVCFFFSSFSSFIHRHLLSTVPAAIPLNHSRGNIVDTDLVESNYESSPRGLYIGSPQESMPSMARARSLACGSCLYLSRFRGYGAAGIQNDAVAAASPSSSSWSHSRARPLHVSRNSARMLMPPVCITVHGITEE